MSGITEASMVMDLIAGIITIIKTTKEIYDTVQDTEGLPKAFSDVAPKLPIVSDTLQLARDYMDGADIDATTYKALEQVVESCEVKAQHLKDIFQKVIPIDGESRIRRYRKAAQAVGKGGRVENLMEEILKNLNILGNYLHFATMTKKKLEDAIVAVSEIDPSLPDNFDDMQAGNYNYGNGPQIIGGAGTQTNNTVSGGRVEAGGFQFLGGAPVINASTNPSTLKG